MFIKDGKRFNIYAQATIDGVTYPNFIDPDLREKLGIEAFQEPVAPEDYSDELYIRTEQDEAPYVIYERKSDEMIAQAQQSKANAEARAYLAETDWMVTRFAETGTPIPDDVKAKRQAARDAVK